MNTFLLFKRKENGQTGQSLVEALILSLTLTILIPFTLSIFWMFTNILWMEHQLYQGILCAAQQKEMKQCKQTTLKQIKKLSPIGRVRSLKIKNVQNEWEGEILWNFYKRDFFIQQTLSLPQ